MKMSINNTASPLVLVVGDVMLDYQYWVEALPVSGSDVAILDAAQNSGGSAANTAISLQMQGTPSAFFGRIGDDVVGKQLISQMGGIGIDLSCVDIFGDSGYTVTLIDTSGERSMLSFRNSKGYQPKMSSELSNMLDIVDILFVSGYWLLESEQAELVVNLASTAKKQGCFVMLDPAPTIGQVPGSVLSDFLLFTDMLMPNSDELLLISKCDDIENGLDTILNIVPSVLLKQGGDGARLVARPAARLFTSAVSSTISENGLDCSVPAEKIMPVDTTGAGDAFNAGFISAFINGGEPGSWLKSGSQLAAKTIASKGAVSGFL